MKFHSQDGGFLYQGLPAIGYAIGYAMGYAIDYATCSIRN